MATFSEMRTRVFNVLRDSEKAFITDGEVGEWVNEGYLDIVRRTRILQESKTEPLDAEGKDALPNDYMNLISFTITTSDGSLFQPAFYNDVDFLAWVDSGIEPSFTIARIFEGFIWTYPAQANLNYTLEYVPKPAPLVSGSDVPLIPEELHEKIIQYARGHAKYKEGELDEGDRYMALYNMGLPLGPSSSARLRPGPLNLVPERGPFDA